MDETVLPGASQTPPSYLRPLAPGSQKNGRNPLLLFFVGIVALVLIIWGSSALYGWSWGMGTRTNSDALIFYSHSPTPNAYKYSFQNEQTESLFNLMTPPPSFAPITPDKGLLITTALSPNKEILAFALRKGNLVDLSFFTFTKSVSTVIEEGIEGDVTLALSPDSTHIAYLTRSPVERAESVKINIGVPSQEQDGAQSRVATSSLWMNLTVASLEEGTKKTFLTTGAPIGFSPDNTKIVVRNLNPLSQEAFSIISYDTNRQQKITGIPDEGKVSGVASLSPDGTLFAFVQDQSVVVGTLDISQAIFSPLTRIKKVAQSLLVTSQDELLLSDVTGVKAYKITKNGVSTLLWSQNIKTLGTYHVLLGLLPEKQP